MKPSFATRTSSPCTSSFSTSFAAVRGSCWATGMTYAAGLPQAPLSVCLDAFREAFLSSVSLCLAAMSSSAQAAIFCRSTMSRSLHQPPGQGFG